MSSKHLPLYGKVLTNGKVIQNGKNSQRVLQKNYLKIFLGLLLTVILLFTIISSRQLFSNSQNQLNSNVIQNPSRQEKLDQQEYKYYLSVAGISRNDGHILREWVSHYLHEGATHFFIGDNDSDQALDYIYVLYDYIKLGVVELFRTFGAFDQYEFYNFYILPAAKKTSKWLLVVDMDEFVYAPQQDRTLVQNIKIVERENDDVVSQVCAPWMQFGSNSVHKQPRCVTQAYKMGSFVKDNFSKCIVQPQHTYQLAIHTHIIKHGITICSNGYVLQEYLMSDICQIGGCSIARPDSCYIRSKDNNTQEYIAITNHYQLQSYEYFEKVRMARKDKQTKEWKAYWNMERFHELNSSIGTNYYPELANKHTVDFCNYTDDLHIGLDAVRAESRAVNRIYEYEIKRIKYRSNYINPNISQLFYDFPDISKYAYNATDYSNLRLFNYNGSRLH